MTTKTNNTPEVGKRLVRGSIAHGISGGVDRALEHPHGTGLIGGVAVITKGRIMDISGDDRAWENDDKTLESVAKLGNKAKQGVKARFGHPNMSASALGTYLGRFKNFVRDGDVVRADLYLDKTAYETPNGNLADYVLSLAESSPDMFGTSIVFFAEFEIRMNKDVTREKDEAGEPLPELLRVTRLFANDVVDDPAMNEGFFAGIDGSEFFNADVLQSAGATEVLDNYIPDRQAAENIRAFVDRYISNRFVKEEKEMTEKKKEDPAIQSSVPESVSAVPVPDPVVEAMAKAPDAPVAVETSEAAFDKGVQAERARISGIMQEARVLSEGGSFELSELAEKLVADGVSLDKAGVELRDAAIEALKANAPASPGPNPDPDAVNAIPDEEMEAESFRAKCEKEWGKSKALRDDFGNDKDAFIAYRRAQKAGVEE